MNGRHSFLVERNDHHLDLNDTKGCRSPGITRNSCSRYYHPQYQHSLKPELDPRNSQLPLESKTPVSFPLYIHTLQNLIKTKQKENWKRGKAGGLTNRFQQSRKEHHPLKYPKHQYSNQDGSHRTLHRYQQQ